MLSGSSERITEILKKVEAAGFDEVILYVNVGLKPHAQVLDEMSRFAEEVRPASNSSSSCVISRASPSRLSWAARKGSAGSCT